MSCKAQCLPSQLFRWVVPLALVLGALDETVIADAPCRVLIVTGEDFFHNWQQTTPVLQELLQRDPRLAVDVVRDLRKLRKLDLKPFGAVVLHFKNGDAQVPGREAFENLRQYVKQGGGLVLVHFACGAFEEFKTEYAELAGRVWFGLKPPSGRRQHDPRGPFVVKIADPGHPITAGLRDFTTDDELYTCLEGDAPIQVLATATSRIDGQSYPMALLREFGDGRVFNCTLGHDVRALATEAIGQLYRRGCAWSAGLPPVPDEEAAPSSPS